MYHIVLLDKYGWVNGVITANKKVDPKDYSAASYGEVNSEIARKLSVYGEIIWYDGTDFNRISDPKRVWRHLRSRGFSGAQCVNKVNSLFAEDLSIFPDEGGRAPINNSIVLKKNFPPIFSSIIQPELISRQATDDDIDCLENEMVKTGLFSKERAWQTAGVWISSPDTWIIVTEWKNKIIGFSCYQLNPPESFMPFHVHIEQKKSRWIWGQVAKVNCESLKEIGIETTTFSIRASAVKYIDYVKSHWEAIELDHMMGAEAIRFKYSIDIRLRNNWTIPEVNDAV